MRASWRVATPHLGGCSLRLSLVRLVARGLAPSPAVLLFLAPLSLLRFAPLLFVVVIFLSTLLELELSLLRLTSL